MRKETLSLRALVLTGALAVSIAPAPTTARAHQSRPESVRLSSDLEALSAQTPYQSKDRLPEHWKKVSSMVRQTLARLSQDGIGEKSARGRDLSAFGNQTFKVRPDGAMALTIKVSRLGDAERDDLVRLGYEITYSSERFLVLEGWLPFYSVEQVALLDFVKTVAPTLGPRTNSGSVESEGDHILGADLVRSQLGITGRGVKVGVISDSVDGITSAVASGDLPSNVQVLNFGEGEGEGTAMLEIVHDLAPDASLAFYGPSTAGDMASGIERLAVAGCNVIVDDLTFFGEPTFQEGMIAQTIDAVTTDGVVYATAAGNFADSSYQANFVTGGPIGGPTHDVHNFGGTAYQSFRVGPNSSARVFLYWSNPFDAPTDDYDLFVVDGDGDIVGMSDDPQDGTGTPLEIVQFTNPSSSAQTFYTVIDRFSGNPQRLELVYTDVGSLQFATAASSIVCNNTAPSALTVAAIDAHDPGNDTIEPFSSQGPSDYFFPSQVRLNKPDIAGTDGVSVTGAAGFGSPFFGTSAAAPHIAALAALALQANPLLTPLEMKITLQRASVDVGTAGFDFAFGSGRANALLAARGVPIVEAAGFIGKKFAVRGNGFDPGAVLFVNGLPQKTKPLLSDPTRTLTSKKAGKLIHLGVTVTLEVRNPDGTTTGVLSFTP